MINIGPLIITVEMDTKVESHVKIRNCVAFMYLAVLASSSSVLTQSFYLQKNSELLQSYSTTACWLLSPSEPCAALLLASHAVPPLLQSWPPMCEILGFGESRYMSWIGE